MQAARRAVKMNIVNPVNLLERIFPMSPVLHLNPDNVYQMPSTTTAIVVSGSAKTVYVGGQGAFDVNGAIVGVGDIGAQAKQVLKNLESALTAGGATLEHVVKWTTYIVNGQPAGPMMSAFFEVWGVRPNPPTTTVVFVSALAFPELLLVMDAVAVVPGERRLTQSIYRQST